MGRHIRALSPKAEFSIVVSVAFGYLILNNVLILFFPRPRAPISEEGLHFLLIFEPAVFLLLGWFLKARGWRLERLGALPSAKGTLNGIGLAIVAYIVYTTIWLLAASLFHELPQLAAHRNLVAPGLDLVTVVAVSVVNPVFEEIFVCGYIITSLRNSKGLWFAINVSAVRLLYHLYQGVLGIVSIIPIGLVFAYWYARTGRLWPVIVAHAIFDFIGLVVYVRF